jgi:phage shock protein C
MTDKKLYRSVSDKWVGGVCGGLGDYFGVDPTVIRIAWVVIALVSMPVGLAVGALTYAVSMFVVPRNPDEVSLMDTQGLSEDESGLEKDVQSNGMVWGAVMILLALAVLTYSDIHPFHHWNVPFIGMPLILVAIGVFFMFKYRPDVVQKLKELSGQRRLYRSEADKKIFGVCGGLADSFSIDPTLVRLGWALGTMLSGFGPGILVYLVLAFILPVGRPDDVPQEV